MWRMIILQNVSTYMQLQQNSKITSSLINKNDRYIYWWKFKYRLCMCLKPMQVVKCMLYTIKLVNHKRFYIFLYWMTYLEYITSLYSDLFIFFKRLNFSLQMYWFEQSRWFWRKCIIYCKRWNRQEGFFLRRYRCCLIFMRSILGIRTIKMRQLSCSIFYAFKTGAISLNECKRIGWFLFYFLWCCLFVFVFFWFLVV